MRIYLIKHNESEKLYAFKSNQNLEVNDNVVCDTCYGEASGIVKEIITSDELLSNEKYSGVYLPLKECKKIEELPVEYRKTYFYITAQGNIGNSVCYNDSIDKHTFEMGNMFKTQEEAEKALKKQQAKIRVIKRISELNQGWLPNWNDIRESKYLVLYDGMSKRLANEHYCYCKKIDNNLYLKSEELAKQLIKEMKTDLLLMLEVE